MRYPWEIRSGRFGASHGRFELRPAGPDSARHRIAASKAPLTILAGLSVIGDGLFARQLVVVAANVVMPLLVWSGSYPRRQGTDYLGLFFGSWGWKPVVTGFAKSIGVLVFALAAFLPGSVVMADITGIPEQADVPAYDYLRGDLPMLLFSLASICVNSSFGE